MANDVRYIKFEAEGAPRVQFSADTTDDEIRTHLKSEQFEKSMAEQGWLYKYGLTPVSLIEEDNLNDNAFVAGAKSSVDTLKQFWGAGMAAMYDVFGAEELQKEAVEAVRQYQLDQQAHAWRKDADGKIKPRISSLEQVFESEQEFSAFLEWLGGKMGEGAVTTLPIVLAGLVSGGVGAGAIASGLVARQAGMGAFRQAMSYGLLGNVKGNIGARALANMTSFGGAGLTAAAYGMAIGDIYNQQLEETDDPNAGIALALGIPYAAAESAFGAGSVFLTQMINKVGKRKVTETLGDFLKGKPLNIKQNIKAANKGQRLKAFGKGLSSTMAGEATAESIQETLTSTGQELQAGRSLSELYSSPDFWKQIGEAAAAGAAGGMSFGTVGGTVQALRVGPQVDLYVDAGGQRIELPNINTDITASPDLYDGFIIGDTVTVTGAPHETVVGPQAQPTGESFNQDDPNNSAFPIFVIAGDTTVNGEQFVLLEGVSGQGDLFVPKARAKSILKINDGTINQNKFNNSAGFIYNQDTADDVDLDSKEVQEASALNKKELKRRGWVDKDTDKNFDENFSEQKEQYINDTVNDITAQREQQNIIRQEYSLWQQNKNPRQERFQMFYEDDNYKDGKELTVEEALENEGEVDGAYSQFNDVDNADLRSAVEQRAWPQERYRQIQSLAQDNTNYISDSEYDKLNELGFRGPFGQQYIEDLKNNTKIVGRSAKTEGRKRLDKILNDNIRFEDETKGTRERTEKVKTGSTIVEPLTAAERVSELGEGIYDKPVGERIRRLRELLHLLDNRGWKWITAEEKTLKTQLKRQKRAELFNNNFRKADAIQKQIDRIDRRSHIIMDRGRIIGAYSPASRSASEKEIAKLKQGPQTEAVTEQIVMYETHINNIDKARIEFNETLATFNEEPTISTEWNSITTRDPRLGRIAKKARNFSFEQENSYQRKYELWAKNYNQPRITNDFADNAPKVYQVLKDIINKMNLDIRVDLKPFLESDGVALAGKYILGSRGVEVAYNAIPELRPNLNRTDSLNYVLHHEVMHLLRNEGFFTRNEWYDLTRAAENRWIKQYKIKERHPELSYNEQVEEAISDAFADYMTGRYQTGSFIARAFNRLKQYLIALGNALTGNRFDTSAAIFNAIDLGLVGARYDSMQRESEIYLTGDNAKDIIVTNKWSGEEISGFSPRTRALFTQQPTITNTAQFFKWFNSGGRLSQVVDDKGAPLIVMHATLDTRQMTERTPFEVFDMERTNDFGFHFTPDQSVIDTLVKNKGAQLSDYYVFRGFANIKNPLRLPDFGTWDPATVLGYLRRKNIITENEFNKAMDRIEKFETENESQVEQLRQMGLYTGLDESFQEIKELIQKKGYDGVVYLNEGEYKHKSIRRKAVAYAAAQATGVIDPTVKEPTVEEIMLMIEEPPTDSYIIFKPQQFKSVFNDGAYGIRQPNMMAANQYQPVPGEKPMDEYIPMNRQQKRALNAKMGKAMEENKKTYSKDNTTMDMPKMSLMHRIAGFVRTWAKDNPLFERVWRSIENMNTKAKQIQNTYQNILFRYSKMIEDPAMREALYRAQVISQYYPNRTFRPDQDGRIIFRMPMDFDSRNSPTGLPMTAGELIILEGDLAQAYVEYQVAETFLAKEQIKGMIAGGYLEQLKSAVETLKFHEGKALSSVYMPDLSNLNTDEELENITYQQMTGIISALRRILENRDAEFVDRSALTPSAIKEIQSILGVDPIAEQPKATADLGLIKLHSQMTKFEEFKQSDYAPLSRFGDYVVTIVNNNEPQYLDATATEQGAMKVKGKFVKLNPAYLIRREHFETKKEADAARIKFISDWREDTGVEVRNVQEISQLNIKEKLEKGSIDMLDVAQYLSNPKQEVFAELEGELRELIKNNKNIIGFDQFMQPRQRVGGVPGYNPDFGRAASQFGFLGSRYAARSRFMNEADERKKVLEDAIATDPIKYKQLKIGFDKWWNYSQDPYQEFAQLRRLGFWWYLGGNLSSAFLQIMSNVQFTGPMLSQMGGSIRATKELGIAFKEATAMFSYTNNQHGDVFIDWTKVPEDVKAAIEEDMPNYIRQGQALQETGQVPGRSGFDRDTAFRNFETQVIGGPFNTMEAISRLTAYIAAYRMGQDPKVVEEFYKIYNGDNLVQGMINDNGGIISPQIIARTMIDDTFGVYGKLNRPQIMRGAFAVPALFQTYIGQMFALMFRLLTGGKTPGSKTAGRKVFARMMVMLGLTGGLFGLPGSDDAEELANWLIEKAPIVGTGLKTDMRAAMREMLYEAGFGPGLINAMENGVIEAGLNIDVQRRLSLGNVPGSQQIRAIAALLGLTPGGNAADFAGAPGSVFITSIREGAQAMREGEGLLDVAFRSSPLFIRNMYKAYDQSLGKGFTETNYGSVLSTDASAMETILQSIGFGSARNKRAREALYQERKNATRNQSKRQKVNAQITNAYRDIFVGNQIGNSKMVLKGQQELNDITRELFKWNNKQDISDMIFPDLNALMQQALEATYSDVRLTKDPLNIGKNIKQRKALGLE